MNGTMRWIQRMAVLLAACSMPVVGARADAPKTPPPPQPPKACAAPEFRQFDFWLGDWTVADPKGSVAGTNLVTLEHGGCVLQEHWKGSKGGTGSSLNIYDAVTKLWHQTWVDSGGTLLSLSGGLLDGRMVLQGPGRGAKGEAVVNRITWEKLADGRVRQTWTVSSDGGQNWPVVFDGYYSKR